MPVIVENPPCCAGAVEAVRSAVEGSQAPVLVAIDGRCASGKTIFAAQLARLFPCAVFHMDDFFLPPPLRTPERLAQPGGNVHYERAARELFLPLSRGERVEYARFNCQTGTMEQNPAAEFHHLSVVEGSYSHHPSLAPYATLKLFFTCDPQIQLARLARRAPQKLEAFRKRWIPLEERYFSALSIPQGADLVVDTSSIPLTE